MAVLLTNHVSVLCIELCVSGGSHAQYSYMIGPGAQSRGASGPCKYFSHDNVWQCEHSDRRLWQFKSDSRVSTALMPERRWHETSMPAIVALDGDN